MRVGEHLVLEGGGPVHGAPDTGSRQPEQLALTVAEAGQDGLRAVVLLVLLVGSVRLLQAAVVRDVLPLSVDTVHIQRLPINLRELQQCKIRIAMAWSHLDGVVAVLVNDTLSLLQILFLGLRLPPVHQVTLAVLLTALVLRGKFLLILSEFRPPPQDSHQTRG